MAMMINDGLTIAGTRKGLEIYFYGADAISIKSNAPKFVNVTEDRGYLGASAIVSVDDLTLLTARLVKNGYRVAIENW